MLASFLRSSNYIFLRCYADDTQLYIAFRPGNDSEETAALTALESCIADISQWMHTNKLVRLQHLWQTPAPIAKTIALMAKLLHLWQDSNTYSKDSSTYARTPVPVAKTPAFMAKTPALNGKDSSIYG